MNNEVGVYARKSRRHRSEFLAFAFLFLSRLFQRRRGGDVFRLATKERKKEKKKKRKKSKPEIIQLSSKSHSNLVFHYQQPVHEPLN